MKMRFINTGALAALLAAAPAAFAQSGAQTGALGTGGSTSNQTAAPNGSVTGNAPSTMQAAPGGAVTPGSTYSRGAGNSATTMSSPTGVHDQGQQLSQDEIQNVQEHLQQQGYYKNARVDGVWGPRTRQAVESFQQAKGLPANGQLDQPTLNALGVNQGG